MPDKKDPVTERKHRRSEFFTNRCGRCGTLWSVCEYIDCWARDQWVDTGVPRMEQVLVKMEAALKHLKDCAKDRGCSCRIQSDPAAICMPCLILETVERVYEPEMPKDLTEKGTENG